MVHENRNAHQETLTQVLDFTADELAMNKQGTVSARQLKRANQWNEQAPLAAGIFSVFWLVITIALSSRLSGAYFFMIPAGLILLGIGYMWHRQINEALQNPQVKQLSGAVRFKRKVKSTGKSTGGGHPGRTTSTGNVSTSYSLIVDGVSFGISRAVYQGLKEFDGSPHQIYYLDLRIMRQLLSMESLS